MIRNFRAERGCGLSDRPDDLVSYQIPLQRTKPPTDVSHWNAPAAAGGAASGIPWHGPLHAWPLQSPQGL